MSKGMVELYDRLLKLADNAESLKIEAQARGYSVFNQGLWQGYEQAYRYAASDLLHWSTPRVRTMIINSRKEPRQ